MSDDHTSQAWGIYGGILKDFVVNTNIKRIADEGARLENVFCTNSICVPSRASIMTGLYSHHNQVFTLSDGLKHEQPSFTTDLKKLGYQSALIGKWHLKEPPIDFDYVKVLPGQGQYHDPVFRTPDSWNQKREWEKKKGFSSDVIADEAIDWMAKRTDDQPFFLMTHFKATHEPFDYPERFEDLYSNQEIPEPTTLWDRESRDFEGQQLEILGKRYELASDDTTFWAKYPGLPVQFSQNDTKERRSEIYQKFIKDFLRSGAAIDDNIGRILDYLDQEDLAENTIIIYTSDQGYFLGEHGFFDKRIMYEEALRMPFVIRYPKEIPAGTSNESIILNHDFPALFLDYASDEITEYGQGQSFRSILKGETIDDWRTSMYYRYWQHLDIRPGHLGVRNDQFKLIYFYGEPLGMNGAMKIKTEPFWEFYDLKEDPGEGTNLIHDPDYFEAVQTMRDLLIKEKNKAGDTLTEIPEL
jgi:arylsulfatase A-like enzyme